MIVCAHCSVAREDHEEHEGRPCQLLFSGADEASSDGVRVEPCGKGVWINRARPETPPPNDCRRTTEAEESTVEVFVVLCTLKHVLCTPEPWAVAVFASRDQADRLVKNLESARASLFGVDDDGEPTGYPSERQIGNAFEHLDSSLVHRVSSYHLREAQANAWIVSPARFRPFALDPYRKES